MTAILSLKIKVLSVYGEDFLIPTELSLFLLPRLPVS